MQAQLPSSGSRRKVVFHDPCYLGRYKGIYDEPRSVAALAGDVVDPPRSRNTSRCCGAGGGLVFLGEEKGRRINVDRAEELIATGAEVIGAACPFCQTMFRDALAQISPEPPQLLDIAQIAALAIQGEDRSHPDQRA
jgi:Fe-S oxidoreductase